MDDVAQREIHGSGNRAASRAGLSFSDAAIRIESIAGGAGDWSATAAAGCGNGPEHAESRPLEPPRRSAGSQWSSLLASGSRNRCPMVQPIDLIAQFRGLARERLMCSKSLPEPRHHLIAQLFQFCQRALSRVDNRYWHRATFQQEKGTSRSLRFKQLFACWL